MHFHVPTAHCIHCRLRAEVCLCHEARRVASDVRLLVVLHAVETRKMSNTGHLATLVVPDCRLAVHGWRQGPPVDLSELRETHAPDGRPWRTVLLSPGLGARPLTPDYAAELRAPDARLRLVVPDGTWSQARRMAKRLPELVDLPRVSLPALDSLAPREAMRPRGNPDLARVSTCEAIAAAFGMLGEPEAERALLEVYDAAALRIALMRGKLHITDHRAVVRDHARLDPRLA